MKYDIITIGGITEDIFIYTKEGVLIKAKKGVLHQNLLAFEYGTKVTVDQAEVNFGGGAANAAVATARLGLKVAAMIAVGYDQRGYEALKNLKDNGVSLEHAQKIKGQLTGFSSIIVGGDKEHVVFPVRGANHYLEFDKKLQKKLAKSKWIYLASLSGAWQESLPKIFAAAEHSLIAWNPGHEQLKAGKKFLAPYLQATTVLILNQEEAKELVLSDTKFKKQPAIFYKDAKNLIKAVASFGPKLVVITLAEKGSIAFDGTTFFSYKPKLIKEVFNTVGVGDAFGSTFIASLMLYNDIDKALELAGLNAARVVVSHGAQSGLLHKKQLYAEKY